MVAKGKDDPASVLRGPEPDLPPTPTANGHLPGYDLGKVMRMNLPAPTAFHGLVYSAKMHTLSGPPEAGKTVLALWLAYKAMLLGHNVLMIDEETGPRQVADLLKSMGAEPELIDKHLTYLAFMDLPWKGEDVRHLHDLISDLRPKLSIFDSAGEILSAAGIDENSPADVTRLYKTMFHPICARLHSAVLLLDHDAKDGDRRGGPSRYSRGTTAKLASPHVAIKLTPLRPFSRVQDGVVGLFVAKDRLGSLHRHWRIRVTASPLDLIMSQTTAAEETEGGSGMSPAAEKMLAVLSEEPLTQQALVDRVVAKYGHGLKRETASRALNSLLEQNLCDRMDLGPGRPALWAKKGGTLEDAPPPPDEPMHGWPAGSLGAEANP